MNSALGSPPGRGGVVCTSSTGVGMSATCSNGHVSPSGAQFCVTCGLAISDKPAPLAASPGPPALPEVQWGVPTAPVPAPPSVSYPYSPPAAPAAAPRVARNGMGIASLVLGILSLLTGLFGLVLGVLAIIFGGVGLGRANRGEATNKTMAGWGLGLGIAGVVVSLFFIAALA